LAVSAVRPGGYNATMGRVRQSLRFSFLDGVCYALMFGLGDTYLAPFAVALGARPQEVGLLTSVPGLAASLSQYPAAGITRRLGRKRTILAAVMLHGLTWLPILLIPWLFATQRALWLVFLATIYAVFGALANPAWFSIMTQYIPPGRRGEYFSFRGRWVGAVTVGAGFAGGLVLWLTRRWGLASFALLFSGALLCRLASWWFLSRQHEPRLRAAAGDEFSFVEFIVRARESNFVRFALFAALYSAATYLAAPFFPVYMLRELGWGYLSYALVNTAMPLVTVLCLSSWGRHADRVGNIAVLRATGLIVAFIPALWLVSGARPFLVLVNVLAGFGWAGYNLAASNFIFDAVSPGKRVRCFSYFTLLNGLGISLGSLAGGYLIPHLPQLRGSRILAICALSTLARLAVWALMLPRVREVRAVEAVRKRDLIFSVAGLRGLPGVSPTPQE
jgi:MFS family permease